AEAQPANELTVVDGVAAKGAFRHPGPAAIFGDVAQQSFAHSHSPGVSRDLHRGSCRTRRKPQFCPLAKWARKWDISHFPHRLSSCPALRSSCRATAALGGLATGAAPLRSKAAGLKLIQSGTDG